MIICLFLLPPSSLLGQSLPQEIIIRLGITVQSRGMAAQVEKFGCGTVGAFRAVHAENKS